MSCYQVQPNSENATQQRTFSARHSAWFISWVLALFGTAVGAGVLFLPIQAGQGGFWVLCAAALLVWPTIAIGHRYYALIPSRAEIESDFSSAVARWLPRFARMLQLMFVVWLFVLLMAYTIGLTNGLDQVLMERGWFGMGALPRPWLAAIVLATLLLLVGVGRAFLTRLLGGLSLVLVGLLVTVTIALAPYWNREISLAALALPEPATALRQFLVLYPLLTLSFMFFPSLSGLVLDVQARLPDCATHERLTRRIINVATLALLGFVLGFVASFMLALPVKDFIAADHQNISALDLVGERFGSSWLGELGPAVSLIALTSSFIGIYVGYRLAVLALFQRSKTRTTVRRARNEALLLISTFCLILPPVMINIPVMDILGDIVAPLGALFLLLVPAGIVLTAADLKWTPKTGQWFK